MSFSGQQEKEVQKEGKKPAFFEKAKKVAITHQKAPTPMILPYLNPPCIAVGNVSPPS